MDHLSYHQAYSGPPFYRPPFYRPLSSGPLSSSPLFYLISKLALWGLLSHLLFSLIFYHLIVRLIPRLGYR